MKYVLGIDSSNYASSAALFHSDKNSGGLSVNGSMIMDRQMLEVKAGELGLRQSDAVFEHVCSLGKVIKNLTSKAENAEIAAVGVSVRPRNIEGSYMPCFMAGKLAAESISSVLGVKCFEFSHQEGHIAAALYSSGGFSLVEKPFYAFHVSGGTTELLEVLKGDENSAFSTQIIGRSLDLKAGQVIDRAGKLLSLGFPAGRDIDELSLRCDDDIKVKPTIRGTDCCLSGVENQARQLLKSGKSREYIAKFCIESVLAAVYGMLDAAFLKYGEKPVVFAGGVMSNTIINRSVSKRLKGGAYFAAPEYSADNAAGIAVLTDLKLGRQ